MDFGFTLRPDHSFERTIALTRQAEGAGFAYGWMFDSHVIWREPYPLLTLMALNSTSLRLGTCVTNPGTREPSVTASTLATLNEISGGRMDLGIGRGDSARRLLGKAPISMAGTEEAIKVIRELVEGRSITYEGTELVFPWTGKWKLPVWIAGYGPMALAMTGRVADGVILQLADPDLIRWFVSMVRDAESGAGREPGSVKVMAAAPLHVGPRPEARDRTRWFPALVSNHVVDLAADDGVEIRVVDTGLGIPAADVPRIFERFYRADKGRSREHGGTGLGLSIVKHIVLAHGGTVRAESGQGRGTSIIILLPKTPPPIPAATPPAA